VGHDELTLEGRIEEVVPRLRRFELVLFRKFLLLAKPREPT
jgi:hypothetical protein